MLNLRITFIALATFLGISPLLAQNIKIVLGPDNIGMNQAFTITVTVENAKLESYDQFPEINGFVKRGTSSSSSTNFVNGRVFFHPEYYPELPAKS